MATATKSATPRRKPVARKTTPKVEEPVQVEQQYTEEERAALITSYNTLVSAGLPVPDEIEQTVHEWVEEERRIRAIEEAERQARIDEYNAENAAGPWYIRNGYTAPFSITIGRATEKRRIELKPRGMPGDMHPLEDADLKDPVLKRNVTIGVCEVIPAGEANRIVAHQTTNIGHRVHTPTAILRSSQGKPYAQGSVKTEVEFGQQGITVGYIDPDQVQGKYDDKSVAKSPLGGIQREPVRQVHSEFIPTGGNPATIQVAGNQVSFDNAQAKIRDDLARRKGAQGPESALGGMQVTINPTQKA